MTVLGFGSDGDCRFLKSQKLSMNFGYEYEFCDFPIAACMHSEIMCTQDSLHILKKMKTSLYDECDLLQIGPNFASLAHLVIIFKEFDKIEHNLTLADIDPSDSMNYTCLEKITDNKVITLLGTIQKSEGTVMFLNIMKSIKKAYVDETTSVLDRLFHATWSLHFLRLWKTWLLQNRIQMCHFITKNAYEGIELNYVFLMKLLVLNKAHSIFYLNSQIVENFFRKLRSLCGVEDLVVNSSVKGVLSRIQRIQIEEMIINDLCKDYKFPRQKVYNVNIDDVEFYPSNEEVENTIKRGIEFAELKCQEIGITVNEICMNRLINPVESFETQIDLDNEDNHPEDILDSESETVNLSDFPENDALNLIDINLSQQSDVVIQNIAFDKNPSFNSKLKAYYRDREIIVSKNRLCFLLQNNKISASKDVRRRFITKKDILVKQINSNQSFWHENDIGRGDCAVFLHNDGLYFGRIINMQYVKNRTKVARRFGYDFISLKDKRAEHLEVLLDPIYQIKENYIIVELSKNFYIKIINYICHANNNINVLSNADIQTLSEYVINRNS